MKSGFPVYDIYTLSGFQKDDFQISRFAPYLKVHPNLHLAHKHNFYHLVLFTDGGGHHTIDFESFPVHPGQIYFMVPGQVHSWAFEGHVDGYVINFSPEFLNTLLLKPDYLDQFRFFDGNALNDVVDIPADEQAVIISIIEQILFEGQNHRPMGGDMVRALLLQLFISIGRLQQGDQPVVAGSYNQTLLGSFQKLVEQHYIKLRLPKDYAAMLYITPNHLNALCKDVLGQSAGEVIRGRVLLEAKRLLVNLNLSISAIAYQLNFTDNSYFSKFFKKYEGITPEEFRNKILSQHTL
ncbi:AraC family transcriptional regulator [Mucilaginibacter yixingensis]|uniref:AraC family transcriptional regulator n=1 Tax=Mucilaginibacter yixingensis TaxID=1295612 RepID=A0A2T5J4S0_9SPHI|nr:helix-turn-helix domain-containing protein [Mucilaginibacter yixingensis]PTQ92668.1 AraC family transcriptional regulator [Mucilaginibacter yixingensis]